MNYTNDKDLLALQKEVNFATHVYGQHNHDESTYFAALIKDKEPEAVNAWLKEHDEHKKELHDFDESIVSIIAEKDSAKRAPMVDAFYHSIADFISGDFQHMKYEQSTINDLFLKHYTAEQIDKVEAEY